MEFQRHTYKKFALMQLKGRWRVAIFAALLSVAISVIFSFTTPTTSITAEDIEYLANSSLQEYFTYLTSNPSSPYSPPVMILSFISMLVGFILEIALVHLFRFYSRSPEPVSISVVFDGLNKWSRGILGGLWRLLWLTIWGLLAIPIAIIIVIPFSLLAGDSSEYALAAIMGFVVIIGFIPMFIKSIEYNFIMFFLAEFPEVGVRKALRLSKLIVKGHRWDIFVTVLSFIGWFLLGAISFGVGLLWVIPYYDMTMTNAYHALLKDALENQKILPEDLN